jgi:V8-like Glu-specific endopeptidase
MYKHHRLSRVLHSRNIGGMLLLILLVAILGLTIAHPRTTHAANPTTLIDESPVDTSSTPASDFWTPQRMEQAAPDAGDATSSVNPQMLTTAFHSQKHAAASTAQPVSSSARSTFPAADIGIVFSYNSDTNTTDLCTGAVVTSKNESLVLTAAHCLYTLGTSGGWKTNVAFCPQYDADAAEKCPQGVWKAYQLFVPDDFEKLPAPTTGAKGVVPYDIGAIVIDLKGPSTTLQSKIGSISLITGRGSEQNVRAYGYPANYGNSAHMYVATGTMQGYYVNTKDGEKLVEKMTGNDMRAGSSGGPWLLQSNGATFINGIQAATDNYKPIAYSINFGDTVRDLYNNASQIAPTLEA